MSAQVYSLLGQTEKGKEAFLEGASIDLSSKLCLTYGDNINYYKRIYLHPLSPLPVGIGKTQVVFKTNQ